MERCTVCNKYCGEPRQVKVGDKVNFNIEHINGRHRRISTRTGKLMLIKPDGYSVIYRKKVYHVDKVNHPDDPTPLSLLFIGMCSCVELEVE